MPPQDPSMQPLVDHHNTNTLQELDPHQRLRSSVVRRESFLMQFAKTKGPPQITFLMMLVAIGLGSTIGVVPAVMSDRFARLNHGYEGTDDCSSFASNNADKPAACYLGSADAQTAVATSNLVSNVFTFLTSSLIGALSDEHGRRGILIVGLTLSSIAPFMLFLIQLIPTMSPWWYYGVHAATGLVNWIAIALSALNDALPQQFRAPGIGLLLAGFSLGISVAPIFALFLSRLHLSLISFVVVALGLLCTIFYVPETLPPQAAEEARRRRELQEFEQQQQQQQQQQLMQHEPSWLSRLVYTIRRFVSRPFREMSILNRNTFFRLISTLAFFSGMVSSGDSVLLVYYLEERLGFDTSDVSLMFLIWGVMGLLAQGVVLKPLNDCVGEKLVVAICFFIGSIDNVMYGVARNKQTIYCAIVLAALTGMAFPTISAIKANNVDVSEQGRIQGALYSLQALASGVGPVVLRFVYSKTKDTDFGPGAMFVFAGGLYLVAVGVACALPKDKANARRGNNNNSNNNMSDYQDLVDFDLDLDEGTSLQEENNDDEEADASYGSL